VRGHLLHRRKRLDDRADGREPFGGEALHRDRLEEGLEPEAADRARPAAGGEDVVAAGGVVARRDRRRAAHEHGARVSDARRQCLRVLAEEHEVLRCQRLHRGERSLEVAVGVHDAADRVRPVLGLRRELELRDVRVGAGACQHDDLGRACGQVDRNLAGDEQLGLVDVHVPGPDDLRDALDIGEPGDRLRPADGPDLSEAELLGGGGDHPGPGGRRCHDNAVDPGDLRRNGAHDQCRDESARDVDADRVERHPAALELDAGPHLEPNVGRPLALVPPANGVRKLAKSGDGKLAFRLRPRRLGAVEA
jgi:hypothetical protein